MHNRLCFMLIPRQQQRGRIPFRAPPSKLLLVLGVILIYFVMTGNYLNLRGGSSSHSNNNNVSVVTTTYYPDTSDIRFNLAIELCKLAAKHNIHLIIVDGSPDFPSIKEQFEAAGGNQHVRVFQQNEKRFVGKGGSLKQAILMATRWFQQNDIDSKDAAIVFTEPEKVDLMNHINDITKPIFDGNAEVIIPTREGKLFKATYPIEQYHSESFGNLHFNLLANRHENFASKKLDWLFGPFAMNAKLASSWLEYKGTSWDAQIIPYVRGVKSGWRIEQVEINFKHAPEMKQQEEGDEGFTRKRLHQLNLLFELLGDKELATT